MHAGAGVRDGGELGRQRGGGPLERGRRSRRRVRRCGTAGSRGASWPLDRSCAYTETVAARSEGAP